MDDRGAHLIWILLAMMLVGSALLSRRIPLLRMVAIATGWVILFLIVYALFEVLAPRLAVWQQGRRGGEVVAVDQAFRQDATSRAGGASLAVPLSSDGHYWVTADVNGQQVRFLIDSGASITAVSETTATQLGLPQDPLGGTVRMQTANGPVMARRSTIASMAIGPIQANELPVVVSATFGPVNVLGMNFLGKLKSWRVEGGTMVLEPAA